jgi:hypothetical protein
LWLANSPASVKALTNCFWYFDFYLNDQTCPVLLFPAKVLAIVPRHIAGRTLETRLMPANDPKVDISMGGYDFCQCVWTGGA